VQAGNAANAALTGERFVAGGVGFYGDLRFLQIQAEAARVDLDLRGDIDVETAPFADQALSMGPQQPSRLRKAQMGQSVSEVDDGTSSGIGCTLCATGAVLSNVVTDGGRDAKSALVHRARYRSVPWCLDE
jgi:hypothetical protein